MKKALDLHRTFEFSAIASLESQTLPCTVPRVEIDCSSLSLSITGNVPEIKSLQIFLADGTESELLQVNPEGIIFFKTVEPDNIVSILLNGKELLS